MVVCSLNERSRSNQLALFCFLFIFICEIERVFIGVWSLRFSLSSLSCLLRKEAPNSKAPFGAYMGSVLPLEKEYVMSNLFKKVSGEIVTNVNNGPEMNQEAATVYYACFTDTGLSLFIKAAGRKYRWDRNLSTDSGCEAAFSIIAAIAGKSLYDAIVEAETSEQGLAMLIGSEFFMTISGFGDARKFKISKTTTHTKVIPDLV